MTLPYPNGCLTPSRSQGAHHDHNSPRPSETLNRAADFVARFLEPSREPSDGASSGPSGIGIESRGDGEGPVSARVRRLVLAS